MLIPTSVVQRFRDHVAKERLYLNDAAWEAWDTHAADAVGSAGQRRRRKEEASPLALWFSADQAEAMRSQADGAGVSISAVMSICLDRFVP